VAEPETTLSAVRVLVAMDTASASARMLEAGAGLAAALGARLEGLFVEDSDLMQLGGLPFAREISAVTGAWRVLGADEIERALRLEAARGERLLAEAAERARVPWSFATARGRLVAQAVAREAELTLLGAADRIAGAARRVTGRGRAHGGPGSLAVLFDASPEAFRALEVAGRLAAALGSELRVLVPQGESARGTAAEQARSWLAAKGRAGLALPLPAGEGGLAEALRAGRSELLVHAVAADLARSLAAIARLIAELSCPLLIVRSTPAPAPRRSPAE
jgi:hypothetical protein